MAKAKKDTAKKTRKTTELAIVGTPAYYQNILKKHPANQKAYERLLVLYRQQKEYKKELHVINMAIKIFEKLYAPAKSKGRTVNAISNQLNKALG